ncbi:MAG: hypothetical protein V7750_08070 [Sneathiella sp.]
MLSKITSTWIIAAFLVGAMVLFSVLAPTGTSQSEDRDMVFSEYAIEADDMSAYNP